MLEINGLRKAYGDRPYLTELEALGAHIAVLDQGRIVVDAPLDQILATYATAMVALDFRSPPPPLPGWQVRGNRLVAVPDTTTPAVASSGTREAGPTDPGALAARALARLGPASSDLLGVEISRPSLETAFLAITGQRLTVEEDRGLVA